MKDEMDDELFLGYCRRHSKSERALFSGSAAIRLLKLAEIDPEDIYPDAFYSIHWDQMQPILDLIRMIREHDQETAMWQRHLDVIDALFIKTA